MQRESRRPAKGDGSECSTIAANIEEPTASRGTALRLDVVDVFAPWAGEHERGLRLRIHKAQTIALRRASLSKQRRAREQYFLAADLAAGWVFQRVEDVELLDRALWALSQMFMAASHLEIVEARDAD